MARKNFSKQDKDERIDRDDRDNSKKGYGKKGRRSKVSDKRRNDSRDGKDFSNQSGGSILNSCNDPEWYAASPALMRDSASLPFSYSVGLPVRLLTADTSGQWGTSYQKFYQHVAPGVMGIRYVPNPGVSKRFSSAVNVAARNIYSYVTSAQSGAKNYEATDLMMYILAMDSIYTMWNFLVRIYGIARTYSQKNQYLPKGLMAAMNVDYDDVINNLSKLRYFINESVYKIGARCVPYDLPLIKRHSFMNQFVFWDQPNEKAQMYVFTPEGYHQWMDVTSSTEPGRLAFKSMWIDYEEDPTGQTALQPWKVTNLCGLLDEMITAVMASSDFNRMSGDIARAYEGRVWKLEEIPTSYQVIPVYDEVVLSQIENSIAMGLPRVKTKTEGTTVVFDGSTADIYQLGGDQQINFDPEFNANLFMLGDKIINAHDDETTPEKIMEWTRLITMCFGSDAKGNGATAYVTPSVHGTEIVTSYNVVTFNPNSSPDVHTIASSYPAFDTAYGGAQMVAQYDALFRRICVFNRHPLLYITHYNNSMLPSNTTLDFVYGELDNYTPLNAQTLQNMHETAALSELAVPLVGAYSKR